MLQEGSPDRSGHFNRNESVGGEQVILSAFVNNSYEIVFGCSRIRQDSIDLTEDQRGFVPFIFEAERKLFCRSFHGLSK